MTNTEPDDDTILARLLGLQDEDAPQAIPIDPARLARLAADPALMTEQEIMSLMLAPSLRRDFALARRSAGAANDNTVFRVIGLAASDGAARPLRLEIEGRAVLEVRPGPAPALPYLLALTLDAALPGGVAGRRVLLREESSGKVWLDATTDAAGSIHAPWRGTPATPADRLSGGERLLLELPAGP